MTQTTRPAPAAPKTFQIPAGTVPKKCTGCGATIYFVPTERGRMTPVRADVPGGKEPAYIELCDGYIALHGIGVTHFADCPRANDFRGQGVAARANADAER